MSYATTALQGRAQRQKTHRSLPRLLAIGIGACLALTVVYFGLTFLQVLWHSSRDEARPADAIVVLGAAQYDGRPSPVLQERLDHALDLYESGIADVVVVTGGRQQDDRFTEATAAATYLHAAGVPDGDILREVSGSTTYESLAATRRFLDEAGIDEVVLVSDPYHAKRLVDISAEVGLDATVSPTDGPFSFAAVARETLAVGLGRLLGHRRLDTLDSALARDSSPATLPR